MLLLKNDCLYSNNYICDTKKYWLKMSKLLFNSCYCSPPFPSPPFNAPFSSAPPRPPVFFSPLFFFFFYPPPPPPAQLRLTCTRPPLTVFPDLPPPQAPVHPPPFQCIWPFDIFLLFLIIPSYISYKSKSKTYIAIPS